MAKGKRVIDCNRVYYRKAVQAREKTKCKVIARKSARCKQRTVGVVNKWWLENEIEQEERRKEGRGGGGGRGAGVRVKPEGL